MTRSSASSIYVITAGKWPNQINQPRGHHSVLLTDSYIFWFLAPTYTSSLHPKPLRTHRDTDTDTHTYTHARARTHTQTHARTLARTHAYTHTHTYTHTYNDCSRNWVLILVGAEIL